MGSFPKRNPACFPRERVCRSCRRAPRRPRRGSTRETTRSSSRRRGSRPRQRREHECGEANNRQRRQGGDVVWVEPSDHPPCSSLPGPSGCIAGRVVFGAFACPDPPRASHRGDRPLVTEYRHEDELTVSSLRAFRQLLRRRPVAPRENRAEPTREVRAPNGLSARAHPN
jgi:hypothetical protein